MSRHAYASRDSPPSHTLLDQKQDPRVTLLIYHEIFGIFDMGYCIPVKAE